MLSLLMTLREELYEKLNQTKRGFKRSIDFRFVPNKIAVFIGMRRTGKTTFLLQTILSLLNKKVSMENILYVNFEDDRLSMTTHKMLVDLVDAFYEQYPDNHHTLCYLFFDEIQNVPNWSQVIRRFFDSKKVHIYLTGSSAKLLSHEIATHLRGRSLATEVWPLSFYESLIAKKIQPPNGPLGQKAYHRYFQYFNAYLKNGGFPESLIIPDPDSKRVLQDYVNMVVMRDIAERYRISNITAIKYLINVLLKNVGSRFSMNKCFNDFKSQGVNVSKDSLYAYLHYLQDSYLLFAVPLYSESLRRVQANPKKIYAIDPGLVNAYTFSMHGNEGHLFENVVYLDLRRRQHEVYYYMNVDGYEVDFVSRDLQGKWHLWQVVWDVNDAATLERETRALKAAMQDLKMKGTLLTPMDYLQHPLFLNS